MLLRSWLRSLFCRLNFNGTRRQRRRPSQQTTFAAMIEGLETRQLLTASPVLANIESTTLANAAGSSTPVTATLTASDTASTTLASATVTISSGFQTGQDTLSFTNTANITGSFNSTTGVLTLTGSDTLANYNAALESIQFKTTSSNAAANTRTIAFQVNDGTNASNIVSRNLSITFPPVLAAIESTPLAYTSGGGATPITTAMTVTDAGNANLTGATVSIASGFQAGDLLEFTDTANIKGAYDSSTGKLTLTGTDTVANYQSALRAVTYRFVNSNQNTTNRIVNFQVTDVAGAATFDSNTEARTISVSTTSLPILAGIESTALTYSVNNAATPITSTLTLTDSTTIASATVQITGNYQSGQDILAFANTANITGSFNATTGTLTLTGNDTAANYQAALRSVTYHNTSSTATGQVRTVTFTATDTVPGTSTAVTRNINVQSSIVVSGLETTPVAYTQGQTPATLTSALTLTDPNNTPVAGATVKISSGVQTGDTLAFTNTANITGSYNSTTGVLTLTGSDTLANYQAALRAVTFTTTSTSTQTRTISFQVGTTLPTTAVARNITVTAVNSVPILSGIDSRALIHRRHGRHSGQLAIAPSLTITAANTTNLTGATITIAGFKAGHDTLSFTNTTTITGTFNATTGVLTLTGTDTVANYQAALRSVTFNSDGARRTFGSRQINFQVSNGTTQSIIGDRIIRVRR